MAQHAEEAQPDRQPRRGAREVRGLLFGIAAGIARWVGLVFAVILVVHVLLTIGEANPQNGITQFFADWSGPIAIGFKNLFTPADPKLFVLVNHGIAAVFWLVVTGIAAKVLRKFT
jgi:hypothetical protein